MTEKAGSPQARTILQQCLYARLQVKPADDQSEAEWRDVNTLLNLKLCEADSGKYVSVLDLPGIVLIVPKATLGGKAKGKGMQYHPNIGKEEGLQLYSKCVSLCEKELALSSKSSETGMIVKHGTYGNRQKNGRKRKEDMEMDGKVGGLGVEEDGMEWEKVEV
ncbi:unnamed protein product, partial [Coregonus sp. 'balchen']